MATKQFLTLEGLTTYDGLIKQYIGTEDAKSIKSLTVSGNTVSFYKTADASGTAAYTVNMPDVSNFMEKISGATGGQVLVSDSNGQAVESSFDLTGDCSSTNIVTGYFGNETQNAGEIVVFNGFDNTATITGSGVAMADVQASVDATEGFDSANTIASALADKMDKIASATGGKLVTSTSAGQVAESNTAIADLATQSDLADKIDKIADAEGDKVVISDSNGNVVESNLDISTVPNINFDAQTGYNMLLVGGPEDGQIFATDIVNSDVTHSIGATAGFDENNTIADALDEKMDKGEGWSGNGIAITHSDGTIDEKSDINVDALITGYFSNAEEGQIVVYDGNDGNDVTFTTIKADDLVTRDSSETWVGDEVAITHSDGTISESGFEIYDIASNSAFVATGYWGAQYDDNDFIIVPSTGYAITKHGSITVGNLEDSVAATTGFDSDNTIADAIADAAADADISLVEAQTPTTGYLKTYELYQGGNAAANLVGKIDIPKDLVVTSGEIVVNPAGQPAGTYLKLTIANQTAPVYINVADLCDAYTAASGATQVQLAISNTNEISATLVAGGVGTTELASNAVTTAKIADDAVTADKVAISAHTEAQTAGSDGVAISVTTTDGQVSAVSASIAANTYDTYGAASGVQTSLVGTSSDPASADTINGAKAYADAATASIPTSSIEALFA